MDSFYQFFYLAFVEVIDKITHMLGRVKNEKKKGIKTSILFFNIKFSIQQ